MKIRNGFVSNSSSSSFIIGSKVNLTKQKLMEFVGVFSAKRPFDALLRNIANALFDRLSDPITSMDWFVEEYGWFKEDEDYKKIEKLLAKGFILYAGSFGTEGEPAELLLCETTLDYEDDEFYIDHQGGF